MPSEVIQSLSNSWQTQESFSEPLVVSWQPTAPWPSATWTNKCPQTTSCSQSSPSASPSCRSRRDASTRPLSRTRRRLHDSRRLHCHYDVRRLLEERLHGICAWDVYGGDGIRHHRYFHRFVRSKATLHVCLRRRDLLRVLPADRHIADHQRHLRWPQEVPDR